MRFAPTPLPGAFLIGLEERRDDRGFFARSFCAREFAEHGLDPRLVQISVSFNHRRGTVRGMHYQAEPFAETKIVRCLRGAMFDVAVDLRPESPTFRRWAGFELTPDNGRALYIPHGCAHGFQTLADDTEVQYFISREYSPDHGRGVRWDDPAFAIDWPEPMTVINERDRTYPDFTR